MLKLGASLVIGVWSLVLFSKENPVVLCFQSHIPRLGLPIASHTPLPSRSATASWARSRSCKVTIPNNLLSDSSVIAIVPVVD